MADDTNTAERITDEMVHAALKAKNPILYRDHLRHPYNGAVLSASTENEIQVTRKMLEAAFKAGRASLAASAGSEPVATIKSWTNGSYWRNYKVEWHRNDLPEGAQLYTHPSPPEGMAGWISVDERLPEAGVTVLVYEPFRHGEDWPGTVRISFDHICPDYEGWHDHCASYEHFMAVGGVNACGPDVTCTGPSEKAPYTHWMPLPAPPASEAKEL